MSTLLLALVACRGSEAQRDPSPASSSSAPLASASNVAPPSDAASPPTTNTTTPPAPSVASLDASVPSPRAMPSSSASPTLAASSAAPSASSPVASASVEPPPAPAPPPPPPGPPAARVATRASGDHWVVDASAPGDCRVDTDCVLAIRLEAKEPFHVNKDYPHRFDANAGGNVQFMGSGDGGRVFSKKAGFFSLQSDNVGMVTVRFRGKAPRATVTGTYALSVCTATTCKLETASIALSVPIQ